MEIENLLEKVNIIKKKWKRFLDINNEFEKPKIYIGIHEGEVYITISDDKTILKFCSILSGKCFLAASINCKIRKENGLKFYEIKGKYSLQVITCQKATDILEVFAIEKLAPVLSDN